ncbi:MAG: 16S rRNA (guanine(527)-N(7))-methyltransferase RsmG [Candidatus Limnocylindrales bacterium]
MNQDREPLPTRVEGLPALPAEALELLDAGLATLRLDLPESTLTRLVDHLRLLIAWNGSINLTAIREPTAIVREHVLDSLAAVAMLHSHGADALLDLGSGGGFPGLPLALVLPTRQALLVESVGKKAAFLTAVRALMAPDGQPGSVEVFAGRAEALAAEPSHRERWPAVVARAIAPLAELAELALPLVAPGGILVAWKRRPLDAELAAAAPALERLGGGRPFSEPVGISGLEDHVLVVIEKVGRSPAGYPRDPGRRRNRPIAAGDPLPSA